MIKVIQQSESEQKQETIELFQQIKPYLDKGYSWNKAFEKVGLVYGYQSWKARRWTRDVVEYAKTLGYDNNRSVKL